MIQQRLHPGLPFSALFSVQQPGGILKHCRSDRAVPNFSLSMCLHSPWTKSWPLPPGHKALKAVTPACSALLTRLCPFQTSPACGPCSCCSQAWPPSPLCLGNSCKFPRLSVDAASSRIPSSIPQFSPQHSPYQVVLPFDLSRDCVWSSSPWYLSAYPVLDV